MTDTLPDPPTHQRATIPVFGRMTPGCTEVILNGKVWQVGDCWYEEQDTRNRGWWAEIFRQTKRAP